jgi:Na+/melibiose symporter-like transporter
MGASNVFIGIVIGSIPSVMNMVVNPVISVQSDRHRGPLGRRIPFLLWPTPFIAFFLITLGYAPQIGTFIYDHLLVHMGVISSKVFILGLICILTIAFQFFFLFVSSIYYYLFADVVPPEFLGRFMAWFRIVGTGAAFVFHRYIFGLADRYISMLYLGIAAVFLVSFIVMCWKVKEGQYDPPPPKTHGNGFIGSIKSFAAECFSHSIYICFFLTSTLFTISLGCTQAFSIFFPRDSLHLNLDQIGKITGWASLVSMPALLVIGWVSDKFHALRVNIFGTLAFGIANLCCFFFMKDTVSYTLWTLITSAVLAIWAASSLPMFAAVLPKQSFGQFCAATAICNSIGLILGNVLAGKLMDLLGDYSYHYLFNAAFAIAAFIPGCLMYRQWKRYGGFNSYSAPTVVASHEQIVINHADSLAADNRK